MKARSTSRPRTAPGTIPYLAFARARAAYALTADPKAAEADLMRALRGPHDLAAEAWFFRARLALDANDFAAARSAARRAIEAGGDLRRAEAVGIELSIRAGAFADAASALDARATSGKKRMFSAQERLKPEAGDLRLVAMAKLKAGDTRTAARLLDEAATPGDENRTRLLAALAKWTNGDGAQAYALAAMQLASAPNDWMALDLAAALARDLGRDDEADAHLGRLATERPDLAALRRLARDNDFDAAFSAFSELTSASHGGVASALAGDDKGFPGSLLEPSATDRNAAALAAAMTANDEAAMRLHARPMLEGDHALGLALAGEAYARLGDVVRADNALGKAAAAAPSFFAPVKTRARLFAEQGSNAAALDLLRDFQKRNPASDRARLALGVLEATMGADGAAVKSFAALPAEMVFADAEAATLYAVAAVSAGASATDQMLAAARSAASSLVLGRIYASIGDTANAAHEFRKALIVDPLSTQSPALYHAAMRALGREEEATSLLTEIVRRRPDAAGAALALKSDEAGGEPAKL